MNDRDLGTLHAKPYSGFGLNWHALLPVLALWGAVSILLQQRSFELSGTAISSIAIGCLLVSVAWLATYSLLRYCLNTTRFGLLFEKLVLMIGLYMVVSSLVFPIPITVGMEDAAAFRVSFVNLSLSIAISIFVFTVLHTPLSRILKIGLLIFAITTVVQAVVSFHSFWLSQQSSESNLVGSSGNVFVMSFDGLQGDIFSNRLEAEPEKQGHLRDFTLFDNVISSSPGTNASTSAEFLGNFNFTEKIHNSAEFSALAVSQGVPTVLTKAGFGVRAYGPYSLIVPAEQNMSRVLPPRSGPLSVPYLLNSALSRSFATYGNIGSFAANLITWAVDRLDGFRGRQTNDIAAMVSRTNGPKWDKGLIQSIDDFDSYLTTLKVGASKPSAHFLHFTFTHHPVDFDSQCSLMSVDSNWFETHQNSEGLSGEAACSIVQFNRFLDRLVEMGIYDSSLVVLKSDHGAPVGWNTTNSLSSLPIRNNPDWGFGRYLPVLMIKKPGQRSPVVIHDERPAILDDLALSLCNWAKQSDSSSGCSRYQGIDLLHPYIQQLESGYYINIVKNEASTFQIDTHETIRLPRSTAPLNTLLDYLSASSLTQEVACDGARQTVGESSRFVTHAGWVYSVAGKVPTLTVRGTACASLWISYVDRSGKALTDRVALTQGMKEARSMTGAWRVRESSHSLQVVPVDDASLRLHAFALWGGGEGTNSAYSLWGDWHSREDWGTWSASREATIVVALERDSWDDVTLQLSARAFVPQSAPPLIYSFKVNGVDVATATFTAISSRQTIKLPLSEKLRDAGGLAKIEVKASHFYSPAKEGGNDPRSFGIGLESITVLGGITPPVN